MFVSYFLTLSPCFATHLVHLSTNMRVPSRKKLFDVVFNQLCTASITSLSSAYFWPCKCSFIGPNKWKSDGARSGLYGGCFNTSNFRAHSVSTICAAVWGRALLWSNNTFFERNPRRFDHIAGFDSFTSMSLYRALVTVWPFSWKCTNIGSLTSQRWSAWLSQRKPVSWILCWPETTDASTASIVSYSLVHNGTRLLSQFDGEKHLLHKHDGPYAPNKSSAVHACDHWTTALGTICYTLCYTRGLRGQYRMQSHDSCWILQQFHQ